MGSGAPDLAAMAATLSGTPLGPEPGVTTRLALHQDVAMPWE